MIKRILSTLVGVLVGLGILWLFWPKEPPWIRPPSTEADNLVDSLIYYREQQQIHADSAAHFDTLARKTYEIYLDSKHTDSPLFDSLRTALTGGIRAEIQESARRQPGALPAAQAGGVQPAKGQ